MNTGDKLVLTTEEKYYEIGEINNLYVDYKNITKVYSNLSTLYTCTWKYPLVLATYYIKISSKKVLIKMIEYVARDVKTEKVCEQGWDG